MKRIFKKNQLIITALAIMIAVAGYLNYSGSQLDLTEAEQTSRDGSLAETVTDDMLAADISAEDQYAQIGLEELSFEDGEIASLDLDAEDLESAELTEGETPGEAVLTSAMGYVGFAAEAKVSREQLRAKNKEILMEVINNTNISEAQKQEAIDSVIAMTDIAEREVAAETLLEAKGFQDVVVSITDDMVDVVVNLAEVDDAGRAQIEDIVKRKTGLPGDHIIITPMAAYAE